MEDTDYYATEPIEDANNDEEAVDEYTEECKKRTAELRDKDLFTQPDESHYGDCPICCLPMPLDLSKSTFMDCCSKIICNGCNIANQMRENAVGLQRRCAFCREPAAGEEECIKRIMKRIKKNDPDAMRYMGKMRYREGDYQTALEYLTKAAELGNAEAHYSLSNMYWEGRGVEKDKEKEMYHLEQAAIAGHPDARHDLGCVEADNGNFDRAVNHLSIAANLGQHHSLKLLRQLYANGHASKEDYAAAYVHIRLPWMQQKVQKGRKQKDFLQDIMNILQQIGGFN